MANVVAVQTLLDGPRNAVFKLTGTLDTSDEAYNVKIDVSTLSSMTTQGSNPPTRVYVKRWDFVISDGLIVNLFWDATANKLIAPLWGRGKYNAAPIGGLVNNAGAGITGDIGLSTSGFSAGTPATYDIQIEVVKTAYFGV